MKARNSQPCDTDEEYGELMKEVTGDDTSSSHRHFSSRTIVIKERSSYNACLLLTIVVLMGIIVLLITESIEIKMMSAANGTIVKRSTPFLKLHLSGSVEDFPAPKDKSDNKDHHASATVQGEAKEEEEVTTEDESEDGDSRN